MGVNIIEITQKNYLNTLIKSGIHVHTTKVQPNSNIGFHAYTCLPYEYHFCQPPHLFFINTFHYFISIQLCL